MNTRNSNKSEEIRNEFQILFEKTDEEYIEHRAQMLSFAFLGQVEKVLDSRGWTRKKLAEEIGTSASYLTQLFRGDRLLNFKTIAKIEKALELTFVIGESTKEERSAILIAEGL